MFENNVYVQNFNKYTFLLTELIKRDISGKYKDSTLGLFWSFLNPLLSMIVLTMVFSLIFANTIENFPVYLLSGKLVFDLFANATTGAMDSIKANSEIIKKIYVPKYMFAVGIVCSEFINFLSLWWYCCCNDIYRCSVSFCADLLTDSIVFLIGFNNGGRFNPCNSYNIFYGY